MSDDTITSSRILHCLYLKKNHRSISLPHMLSSYNKSMCRRMFPVDIYINIPHVAMFGVFDGHGGGETSKYCSNGIQTFLCESFIEVSSAFEIDHDCSEVEIKDKFIIKCIYLTMEKLEV